MGKLLRRLSAWTASFLVLGHVSAQNILNNTGFEYGLMCYLTNVWSYTGEFGKGDYKIQLSPDAHSGSQSIEISCTGSDCFKASVISNRIPSAPNENYILRLYAKCLPGATAAVYIPETAGGDTFVMMNCTGAWELNTINFRTSPTAQNFFYYLFSYYGGWVRYDDATITYADGTVPTSFSLYPGTRNVSVSNRTMFVDGNPYLALGFFNVTYNDLAQAAATGANTVFGLGFEPPAACFNTKQKGYPDRVFELGMNFVPESSTTARLGVPSVTASAVQRFAPHRANIAWMLADEPDQTFVPFWYIQPSKYLEAYAAAKSRTSLPVFADFQRASWSLTSDVSPYQSGSDLLMAEPYGPYLENVTHATDMFKSFSPARPIWMAQDDTDVNLIVPKAYWSVINGSTGIGFFDWPTFKANAPKMAAAQQTIGELKSLKNVIFSQNVDTLVNAGQGVGTMTRYSNGSAYILAVNPAPQNVQATFQMSGLQLGQKIQVMFEGRTISANAGSFTDSFAGVARHVYVIKAPLAEISGSILAKSGPDNARKWTIQISNTGLTSLTGAAITSASFVPNAGAGCTPGVLSTLPVVVGTIAPASSATGDLTVSFNGCRNLASFTVDIRLAANGGSVTSSIRSTERK
jgi:hypothetical protein